MNIRLFSVAITSILSVVLLSTVSIAKPTINNTKFKSDHLKYKTARANVSFTSTNSLPRLALSQNTEVICGNGSTTYARAETKGYYVNICGDSDGPNRYLGAGKSGQAIVLPLQSHSTDKYTAVSGNIRYTLTPNYLTGRTLLKQKVINWR
jgi:hypothetical protein